MKVKDLQNNINTPIKVSIENLFAEEREIKDNIERLKERRIIMADTLKEIENNINLKKYKLEKLNQKIDLANDQLESILMDIVGIKKYYDY